MSSVMKTRARKAAYCGGENKNRVRDGGGAKVDGPMLERTSLSIQGRPLQVATQPKSPKSTMAAPVPVSTYGPLEGLLEISSM